MKYPSFVWVYRTLVGDAGVEIGGLSLRQLRSFIKEPRQSGLANAYVQIIT